MGRSKDRPIPMLAGVALIAAGVLFLGYAFFQYSSIANDPSYAGVGWRDAYEMRDTARGMLLGLSLVVLGILVVALRLRDRLRAPRVPREAEKGAAAASASHPAAAPTRPDQKPAPAPAPTTAPSPKPAPAPAPKTAPSPKRPDGGVSPLEQVLPRSDDALATLRYFIVDAPDQLLGDQCELVRRTGLADWTGEPRCGARRLARCGRWWLVPTGEGPKPSDMDRIWAIEAALNLGRDAARLAEPPATLDERLRVLLAGVSRLEPVRHPGSRFLADATEGADPGGEWAARVAFADALENLPVPFRMVADFRLNVSDGLLGVRAAVPRPAAFSFMPEAERIQLARAYAYDLALLVARTAFAASPAIRRVTVNCHEDESVDCVLSADFERSSLERASAAPREGGLPNSSAELRYRPAADGWLAPVAPLTSFVDRHLRPVERYRPVELSDEPCPEAVVRACGAHLRSELGIAESVVRWDAWERLADDFGGLGDTTEGAVEALSELRASASDASIIEACERTTLALVSGELDVEDADGLIECFVHGSALERAVRQAGPLVSAAGEPDHAELSRVAGLLEDALAPVEALDAYRDDERTVHRYFRSAPERVTYNLDCADGRAVRLVPDAYFLAHQYASVLERRLALPGSLDRALAHAERASELAPCTVEATIARADCLRDLGRADEAVRAVSGAAARCSTVDGLSLCLYRLAALVYDLGMVEASVACYRRCIELGRAQAEPARRELAVLVEHEHEALAASRLDPATLTGKRLTRALEGAGLPAGGTGPLSDRLRAAAAACTDAGIFSVARPLLQAYLQAADRRDDALADVLASLSA